CSGSSSPRPKRPALDGRTTGGSRPAPPPVYSRRMRRKATSPTCCARTATWRHAGWQAPAPHRTSPRRSPAPAASASANQRSSPRDLDAIRCPRPVVRRARARNQRSRAGARIALPRAARAAAVRSGGRGDTLPAGGRRRPGGAAHPVPIGGRMTWLTVVALAFAVAGMPLVIGGLRALWRARGWGFTSRALAGLLLLWIGL